MGPHTFRKSLQRVRHVTAVTVLATQWATASHIQATFIVPHSTTLSHIQPKSSTSMSLKSMPRPSFNLQVGIDLHCRSYSAHCNNIDSTSFNNCTVWKVEDRYATHFSSLPSELWVGSLRPPECRSIMPVNCFAACQRYSPVCAFNDIRLRQFHSQFIIIFAASSAIGERSSENGLFGLLYLIAAGRG